MKTHRVPRDGPLPTGDRMGDGQTQGEIAFSLHLDVYLPLHVHLPAVVTPPRLEPALAQSEWGRSSGNRLPLGFSFCQFFS